MKFTGTFFKQHDELIEIVTKISQLLDVNRIKTNFPDLQKHLSDLSRTLNSHLLMEDRGLYPVMLEHGNVTAKELARLYMDEMGGLKSTFIEYVITWKENRILENPQKFIDETKSIFAALGNRIEKENTILYPFVEKLFFKYKESADVNISEEEWAAKLEINRMNDMKKDSEIKRKIALLVNQAESEVIKQKKKWLFKNYERAIHLYREAYLLGYDEGNTKIRELSM